MPQSTHLSASTTTDRPLKRGDTVIYRGDNAWFGRTFTVLARLTPERQSGFVLGYTEQAYEVCVESRSNGRCRVRQIMRGSNLERAS
jgi:hypothetical protein